MELLTYEIPTLLFGSSYTDYYSDKKDYQEIQPLIYTYVD